MREFFYSRKKYALPAIHFLLSFLYERCIFLFREEENIIYAARFHEGGWDSGLEEMDLLERFDTIRRSWYSE
jgi:hypothetical protein